MDRITREDIQTLVQSPRPPAVTLRLPTHRVGPDTRPFAPHDVTGWKTLLRDASTELEQRGVERATAAELLEPGRALLDRAEFWQYQSDGLVAFASPGVFQAWRLPIPVKAGVYVGTRYSVLPLVPMLTAERFYILALSQKSVRVIEAGRDDAHEIDLRNVPRSLQEALRFDVVDATLNLHTVTGGAPQGGRGRAMFHGHGVGHDDSKERILEFCHQVDRGVREMLHGEAAPLVLAGVEFVTSIYRQTNEYPHLVESIVAGNSDGLTAAELQARAWPVVEPVLLRDREQALGQFHEPTGRHRATGDLAQVLTAAVDGRIDTLFFDPAAAALWGRIDDATRQVVVHEARSPGDEDLVNVAACGTLAAGGRVFAVPATEGGPPLGALLRY